MNYTKEIPITPEIAANIKRVNNGSDIDTSTIAVFEARSLNTRPLRRKNGIYAGAVAQDSMLQAMVQQLNSSNEGLPFHIMHNTDLLNVGKVFMARLDTDTDGARELSSLFYIPREFTDLIARLNTSVVDQVSVGVQAQTLKCSHCDFDYRQGSFENILAAECDNGHTIGENGVHVEMIGLESWFELSAVDRGAAQDARIVNSDTSRFIKQHDFYQLAAKHNQNNPTTVMPLVANLAEEFTEETHDVTEDKVKEIVAEALAAAAKTAEDDKTALQSQINTLKADKDRLEAELAAEQAKDTAAELKTAKDALAASEAISTAAMAYLKEQANKAQIATGTKTPLEAKDVANAIELIETSGLNLFNLFARDKHGETNADNLNAKDAVNPGAFNAYKRSPK